MTVFDGTFFNLGVWITVLLFYTEAYEKDVRTYCSKSGVVALEFSCYLELGVVREMFCIFSFKKVSSLAIVISTDLVGEWFSDLIIEILLLLLRMPIPIVDGVSCIKFNLF